MPEWRDDDFEHAERQYRARVARRYRELRLAHRDRDERHRLRALRRLDRGEPEYKPRANRRPALLLALVFVVLAGLLYIVADANGGGHPAINPDRTLQATSPAGTVVDAHQIRSTICDVFTGTRCGPAIRVAKCETGGTFNPRALGRAGERGLFQIHPVHFRSFDRRRLFEPRYNARAAYRLSRGGRDWSPWTCQP